MTAVPVPTTPDGATESDRLRCARCHRTLTVPICCCKNLPQPRPAERQGSLFEETAG